MAQPVAKTQAPMLIKTLVNFKVNSTKAQSHQNTKEIKPTVNHKVAVEVPIEVKTEANTEAEVKAEAGVGAGEEARKGQLLV